MFSGIGGFELGIQQAYASNQSTNAKCGSSKPDSDLLQVQQREAVPEVLRSVGRDRNADEMERGILPSDNRGERPVCSNTKQQAYEENNATNGDTIEPKEQSKECSISNTRISTDITDSDGNRWRTSPTCVGYSEIDKYAVQVYQKQFPNHKNYGNATTINPTELPDFDMLVGGFPCQAFSIAGKRAGFNDTRGTLFFDIARILSEKRPRLVVLENVKGLLSHDKGKTFQTILGVLSDLGYGVEWQVLNSKNFGVPQNRERVFIIGHLRGTSRPEVFPIGGGTGEIASDVKVIDDYNKTRRKDYGSIRTNAGCHTACNLVQLNKPKHSNDRVYSEEGLSPTLNTMQGGNRQPFVAPVLTPDRLNKRQNGRRFKENGEPAFTVTAQDRHGVLLGDIRERKPDRLGRMMPLRRGKDVGIGKIRRLTPTECERLQGFPDNWTAEGTEGKISDTQRYKMAGNAVSVNVIKAIMEKLLCG